MPPLCIPSRTTSPIPLLNNNINRSLFPLTYHSWPSSVSILCSHSFHPFSATQNKKQKKKRGIFLYVILEEVRIPRSMGISLSRNIINVFLSLYHSKKVIVVPGNLFHVQIEDVVSLVSRTGRHLQRYDKGRRQVVGCIPYRYKGVDGGSASAEEIEVLLVSSQKGGKGMMFPKGGWEIDETMEQAALRETREEAGVVGTLEDNLGKWRYKSKSNGSYHDGYMFSLLVHEQLDLWPEKDLRKRRWATVAEAREACPHGWMKEALDELVYRLPKQQNGKPDVFPS